MLIECPQKAFTGNYPSIALLRQCYGQKAGRDWLLVQLEDVNAFIGSTVPMEVNQMMATADLIAAQYHYFTVAEFMLFFSRFKLQHYGEIYGSLKPSDITSALLKFKNERANALDAIDKERQRRQRDLDTQGTMTRQQWLEYKKTNS